MGPHLGWVVVQRHNDFGLALARIAAGAGLAAELAVELVVEAE